MYSDQICKLNLTSCAYSEQDTSKQTKQVVSKKRRRKILDLTVFDHPWPSHDSRQKRIVKSDYSDEAKQIITF